MGNCLNYIFCCGCFGDKYVKKDDPHKEKTLAALDDIKPSTVRKIASDPSVSTEEMTDYHNIPNPRFQTELDVIKSYGYEIGQLLGQGGFAQVFRAKQTEKNIALAVKICEIPTESDKKSNKIRKKRLKIVKRELFILQEIRHPHIIQMIQHFIVSQKSIIKIYIFMQLAEHGDLSTLCKNKGPFDEKTCKLWFAQILCAMVYMHNKSIAHRDLKLLNILLDSSDDALVTDFGLSQVVERRTVPERTESRTYCGTPPFMAPEIIEKKEGTKDIQLKTYDPFAVDVWALGVILYTLLNKCYPFHSDKEYRYDRPLIRMRKKQWTFSQSVKKPDPLLKDLLSQIFEPEPHLRPKISAITKHKWVSDEYKKVDQKFKKWKTQLKDKTIH